MSENKLTIEQLFEVIKNQETRIDHNFSTTLSLTILVEFIFDKLKDNMPDIAWEEEFDAFQEARINEFNEIVEQAQNNSEAIQEQAEEIIKQIKL